MARRLHPPVTADPRARGRAAKQSRLDSADRQRERFPWLIPAIVVVAAVIVVGGIVWAIALGRFF